MRVLITGGTGFIGCYTARKLLDMGHEPLLLDLNPNQRMLREIAGVLAGEAVLLEGDILDREALLSIVQKSKADPSATRALPSPPGRASLALTWKMPCAERA